ncbi:hypothetical protein L1887_53805 [Cichorium endivia]|nr:hypothetical protein L1887_53805 [Cichorium endivia]
MLAAGLGSSAAMVSLGAAVEAAWAAGVQSRRGDRADGRAAASYGPTDGYAACDALPVGARGGVEGRDELAAFERDVKDAGLGLEVGGRVYLERPVVGLEATVAHGSLEAVGIDADEVEGNILGVHGGGDEPDAPGFRVRCGIDLFHDGGVLRHARSHVDRVYEGGLNGSCGCLMSAYRVQAMAVSREERGCDRLVLSLEDGSEHFFQDVDVEGSFEGGEEGWSRAWAQRAMTERDGRHSAMGGSGARSQASKAASVCYADTAPPTDFGQLSTHNHRGVCRGASQRLDRLKRDGMPAWWVGSDGLQRASGRLWDNPTDQGTDGPKVFACRERESKAKAKASQGRAQSGTRGWARQAVPWPGPVEIKRDAS